MDGAVVVEKERVWVQGRNDAGGLYHPAQKAMVKTART